VPDPKVEEAAVVEASAKKKSERGRWRLSLEMRKDKEDEIEREPETGKKKKKVNNKSVKKKGQKNSENHSQEAAAGGKKEEREKKADREDKDNEEVQARQITDEDLSPSSKLSDSPRSPPEDNNKEDEAESDEADERQSSPSDTTHNDSDKEEGSPIQQPLHEESGAGAMKPMASTARVSSLRELSPARGIPKTSGSESDASRKSVGVETKKKQLIGLRMFESADGASSSSSSSASSKKSSAKGGMTAAVSDKRHKHNDPIRRRRRSTLDDATSEALTKLAKQTPSNNKRPTMSPIIAHLAMPFMGQSQKGTLEDSANPLPTISENSPTESGIFQWPDKSSHKNKDDDLTATLKIRNRRKRSSIVTTPQTTPVLQALAEANFTDQVPLTHIVPVPTF